MSNYIDYTILINKLDKLDIFKKDCGKLVNTLFTLDEFKCFPENIIFLLQDDLSFFKKLIEFHNSKYTLYINKCNNITEMVNLKTFLKCFDKDNITKKIKYKNFNKEITPWLETTEFFNNIINTKKEIKEEELNKIKELKKIELHNSEKFTWRENQLEAIDRLNKNGLETGIHCQATGTGKSYIILKYIEYMKTIKPNPKIILFTERVNILADLFHFKKGILVQDDKILQEIKEKGICNITDFNIINRVTNKNKDWHKILKESISPTLLVINRAFLTLGENKLYKKFTRDDIDLVLHDECHNTTSVQCHDFLLYMKEINIKIVGFSATPLRTGKFDKSKLLQIYANPDNDTLLNLLTNYNMIYSIQQGLILPPEFYWYQIENTKKQKDIELVTQEELGSVLELLNQIVPLMPNKKLIAWCGTITLARKWKELFEKNHKQRKNLKDFTFGLDTSFSSTDEYDEFKNSNGNCILFCAQKHREGSDIRLLDGCIFLDKVKDRGCIPFIQSIGRVLRLCQETPDKTKGIIIDGYVKDNNEYEKSFIDKIIGYYMMLLHLTEVDGDMTEEPLMNRYIKLLDIIKFDKKKEVIKINFGKVNIRINCNRLNWDEIIKKFEPVLQQKIQLSEKDKLLFDFNKLKNNIKNLNLTCQKDYLKLIKNKSVDDFNLINNPNIVYCEYWISWYDFFGIDISIFPKTMTELKQKINLHKIRTSTEYDRKAPKYNLPLMPKELYNDFTTFEELNL